MGTGSRSALSFACPRPWTPPTAKLKQNAGAQPCALGIPQAPAQKGWLWRLESRRLTWHGQAAVSQTQIFLWCIALGLLEINHLKWIWWEHWDCGKCGRKHKDCGCSSKWIMYL
jgi:hypothetical protein